MAKQKKSHLFQPGQSGNPKGRPKGSRNKLGEEFLTAMLSDFKKHGAEVIERVRTEKPEVYMTTIARIIPKQIDLTGETVTWVVAAEPEPTVKEWQQKHSKSSGDPKQAPKPH